MDAPVAVGKAFKEKLVERGAVEFDEGGFGVISLGFISEAGIAFDNNEAHSAAYDAERTAELFCDIVNRWKESGGWLPDFS